MSVDLLKKPNKVATNSNISTSKKRLKVIISGGGSGGHIFPAIAIANALKKKVEDIDILFVGAKGKIEMEKVPKAGYPIKGLWISGLHRKEILRNLTFPLKLISSIFKANSIIRKFKPDVVVGVGGFASGPTLAVASRRGIPTIINEQNSYAGLTNKLLAKKTDVICVAFPKMERFFTNSKLVMTGNPVRKDIVHLKGTRNEGIKHFGLDENKKTIIIVGGSLGAKSLNEAMAANTENLKANPDVQVLWQAGKLYIERFQSCDTANLPNVKISAFIDRMDLAYLMADIVVCRAGALTIGELAIVGIPTILIPSPNVAEDHQTVNAMALVEKGAAILVKDKNAKKEIITSAIEVLNNEAKQKSLRENILTFRKPAAAENIAAEVLKLIKK